jgi:hypothetical protein
VSVTLAVGCDDADDLEWLAWTPEEWKERLTNQDWMAGEDPEHLAAWRAAGVGLLVDNCRYPWTLDVVTGLPV